MHDVDRAGRDESRHGGGARACQPAAGPVPPGRHLRHARARPGAAAGRGFPRRHRVGQRLLQARVALLRPDHASGAVADGIAARDPRADRSRRLRTGDARDAAGRAGDGLRLSGGFLRAAAAALHRVAARSGGNRRGAHAAAGIDAAADRRRRWRPLRARERRIESVRRRARRPGRRDASREGRAAVGRPDAAGRDRRHRVAGRERACTRRGRRHRDRHAAAGFHDRLALDVRPRATAVDQRRGFRRAEMARACRARRRHARTRCAVACAG